MSDNWQAANEFIRELREKRAAYRDFADKHVTPLFREGDQRERTPPTHFVDSSYLYVRSFEGDNGARPFGNKVFWRSPDIRISPVSNLSAVTQTLTAGQAYVLRCIVRNRGDMAVPSAKVEFWLTDPSLGFDTRYATHLTAGRVPSGWVNAYANIEISYTYTVPLSESGHKCLFARAFSFAPPELPIDDHALDPTIDRRIAQQNLNIVGQGQPFQFQVIHTPNANLVIQFFPLTPEEVLRLPHPFINRVTPFTDIPREGWVEMARIELGDTDVGGLIDLRHESSRLIFATSDPDGVDAGIHRKVRDEVRRLLAAVEAGEARLADHRDVLTKFREVNGDVRRTSFHMRAPDLGMPPGHAVGLNIRSVDRNDHGREPLGGLTLLIVAD